MATKGTGLTGEIHKRIQQIKTNEKITIGGFVNYALYKALSRKGNIRDIVNMIERDTRKKYGAGRLDQKRFGNDLPK